MASSSVSQDDVDVDFEITSRRTRIRTARARQINHPGYKCEINEECAANDKEHLPCGLGHGVPEHDVSPKPSGRIKEKRLNRPNHTNKGKLQRDRRKLREKRRSTGVVHLPTTEFSLLIRQSTGGSSGEDDDQLLSMNAETRRNTHFNENAEKGEKAHGEGPISTAEYKLKRHPFIPVRNKSPSDLEADDEDNQDYDSLTMSDSTLSLVQPGALPVLERSAAPTIPATFTPLMAPRSINGNSSINKVEEELELAKEENKKLILLLEDRESKITSLETNVSQLTYELSESMSEKSNLKQENSTLLRAMASLGTK